MTRILPSRLLGSPGFIDRHGHVFYNQVIRKPQSWRIAYIETAMCEFAGSLAPHELAKLNCRGDTTLVFDHCHQHGWVRGVLCNGHNVKVGYIELVASIEGIVVDLGVTAYARWIARCPDCAGLAHQPSSDMFRLPGPKPRPRPGMQFLPGPPVGRAAAAIGHLRSDERRTACGLVADAMVPVDGRPLCRICARGQAKLARPAWMK